MDVFDSSTQDTINESENIENGVTGSNSRKKKRSDVWPHFSVVSLLENDKPIEYAQCNYCPTKYKVAGKSNAGTGNLRSHLSQKHPDVYAPNVGKKVEENFVFSQEKFREALLQWVVVRDQPFTEVQEKAFLILLETLNPEASSVSDKTIRRDMMKAFLRELEINKSRFKNLPGRVSFTIDGWTSKNVLCFVAIRAHFINVEWKYESLLVDFIEVDGHKGLDLKATFLACLERFEIRLSKVMAITLDNVESNQTFMELLEKHGIDVQIIISPSGNRIRCMAHILNLAVQDIMHSLSISLSTATDTAEDEVILPDEETDYEDIDMSAEDETDGDSDIEDQPLNAFTVAKLRKLVKKIRKSDLKRKQLRKMCELCSVKYLAPIIDVSTRWNSTFEMLERASKLKKPLLALCSSVKPLRPFIITEGEWAELDKLFILLKKFDRSTKLVSMERHPTISAYLPTLNWLMDSLKSFIRDNPGQLADAASNGLQKLQKYNDKLDIENSLLPYVAVFMNPALKLNYFKEHKYRNIKEIQKRITEMFERDYAASPENIDPNEKEQSEDEFYAHMYKRAKLSKATKEIQKYLQFPLSSSKIDQLEFWRSQEGEFPGLTRMARDILPIQSASVAVERDFSSASDIVTTKQCALKAETIRAKMCLKMWYKSRLTETEVQRFE